uniref:VOC family protein n=1 Tax=Altererythrobacter segetis TaxID=1104773 RepID=UPI00140C6742|nr:VOC family protein [Altererythrobacter segetis]
MDEGKVLGIGGLFLRADDPGKLSAWYREHLGFTVTAGGEPAPDGYWSWKQEAGDTVFSFFPRTNNYFSTDRQMMLNFRVSGLDSLVAKLAAAGIAAERKAEWDHPSVGRFARIRDPEGNPIELWEPPAE